MYATDICLMNPSDLKLSVLKKAVDEEWNSTSRFVFTRVNFEPSLGAGGRRVLGRCPLSSSVVTSICSTL